MCLRKVRVLEKHLIVSKSCLKPSFCNSHSRRTHSAHLLGEGSMDDTAWRTSSKNHTPLPRDPVQLELDSEETPHYPPTFNESGSPSRGLDLGSSCCMWTPVLLKKEWTWTPQVAVSVTSLLQIILTCPCLQLHLRAPVHIQENLEGPVMWKRHGCCL